MDLLRARTTVLAGHQVEDSGTRPAGPEAARHAKKLVLERPDGLGTERRIAQRRTSDEGQEGLRAFLEKRDPDWKVR